MQELNPITTLDWGGALVTSVALLAILGTSELLWRFSRMSSEGTRKLSHVGAGAVSLCLPWLVDGALTVFVLAGSFLGLLVAGRLLGTLHSIHAVERKTSGAYCYPLAVMGVFWLSGGEPGLYCPPILVLALSDSAAAIVGQRYGRGGFSVPGSRRTWVGCATFFGMTTLILLGWAIWAAHGFPLWALPLCFVGAAFVTATEALSLHGSDNLLVPLACFVVLRLAVAMNIGSLGFLVPS